MPPTQKGYLIAIAYVSKQGQGTKTINSFRLNFGGPMSFDNLVKAYSNDDFNANMPLNEDFYTVVPITCILHQNLAHPLSNNKARIVQARKKEDRPIGSPASSSLKFSSVIGTKTRSTK